MLGAVFNWLRRLSTLAIMLVLGSGNAAVCAGWLPTPEARMACCAEGGSCPMHKGESSNSGSARVITQAQADHCCASSERDSSSQSNPTFVASITQAVLGTGVILPALAPARVLSDAWRAAAPPPTPPVPKHVLLAVFLV
jgi:hypothetical protein